MRKLPGFIAVVESIGSENCRAIFLLDGNELLTIVGGTLSVNALPATTISSKKNLVERVDVYVHSRIKKAEFKYELSIAVAFRA